MKVLVVSGSPQYLRMFQQHGWDIVHNIKDADLIQFTGGEDVTPSLYGDGFHMATYSNLNRDDAEKVVFKAAMDLGIPMAGICRGGQFLNVMNGGKMWQDTAGHAIRGTHEVIDLWTHENVQVSSTHHQIMRVGADGVLVAKAQGLSNKFETVTVENGTLIQKAVDIEAEVVWYPATRSLCFQPHPEFDNVKECTDYYFDCIERYIVEGQ